MRVPGRGISPRPLGSHCLKAQQRAWCHDVTSVDQRIDVFESGKALKTFLKLWSFCEEKGLERATFSPPSFLVHPIAAISSREERRCVLVLRELDPGKRDQTRHFPKKI